MSDFVASNKKTLWVSREITVPFWRRLQGHTGRRLQGQDMATLLSIVGGTGKDENSTVLSDTLYVSRGSQAAAKVGGYKAEQKYGQTYPTTMKRVTMLGTRFNPLVTVGALVRLFVRVVLCLHILPHQRLSCNLQSHHALAPRSVLASQC